MEQALTITSSVILLTLIGALIFKKDFRKDILVSEGEATIFGILNVKGVAIIVLSGLFLGALIWSTSNKSKKLPEDLANTVYQNQLSHFNQIKIISNSISREVFNYYNTDYLKGFSKGFSNTIPNDVNFNNEIEQIIERSSSGVITNYRNSIKILDDLKNKSYADIVKHYKKINLALQKGDFDEYNRLIETTPTSIIKLQNLDHIIVKISTQQDKKLDDYLNEVKSFISNE